MPKTNDKNIIITDEITTSSVDQLDNEMAQLAAHVEAENKRELQTGGDATPVDAPFGDPAGETSLSSASNDVEFEIDNPHEDSTFYQHLFSSEADETTLPDQTPAASETRASEPIESNDFEMIIKAEVDASVSQRIQQSLYRRRGAWNEYCNYVGHYHDGELHIQARYQFGKKAELAELKELIKRKYPVQDHQLVIKPLPPEQRNWTKKIDASASTETHERKLIGYEIIVRGESATLQPLAYNFTSGGSVWTKYHYKAVVTENKLTLQPYETLAENNHLELIELIKEKYPNVRNIVYNPVFALTKKRSAADNIDTQAPAAKKPVIDKLETQQLIADFRQKFSNQFFSMGKTTANNVSQRSNCKSAQTLFNNVHKR